MSQNHSPIFLLQQIALGNVFDEDMNYDYYYRKMCRSYSKMFFTPLEKVMEMPFHDILTHLFENRFEEIKESEDGELEIKILVAKTLDPDYEKHVEEEQLEFMKKVQQNINASAQTKVKPVSKTYHEPPPPEVQKPTVQHSDGLDDLVTGIGAD